MGLIWGVSLSAFGLVVAILIPVMVRVISDDVRAWLPWVTRKLIERALRHLPERERERFEEEWWAHVSEWPGDIAKVYVAWGYLAASRSIGHAERFRGAVGSVEAVQNWLRRFAELVFAARTIKATIDITVAGLILIPSSFLFLILAIASRLDGGPMLFAHRRVGAGGRPFYCLKFRTMVVDADRVLAEALARDHPLAAEWEATRILVNDPRVTRLGRILRKTSLDELPQLINVLRLEMSLVGPRPIVESEVPLYGEAIAQYYATRPGLTGLWQVSGLSDGSYERRVELDAQYVKNWSIRNDIILLFRTIAVVLLGRKGTNIR